MLWTASPWMCCFVWWCRKQQNRTHLDVLAMLTRIFSEADNLASLREATTDTELFDTICWQMDEVQQW